MAGFTLTLCTGNAEVPEIDLPATATFSRVLRGVQERVWGELGPRKTGTRFRGAVCIIIPQQQWRWPPWHCCREPRFHVSFGRGIG